ncbi:MAG: helix-turn-helix transcriptional regulator [Clostridia bacterium]|nr:helix-turn-helix transcriptional regulator [Clostridia bacterium]
MCITSPTIGLICDSKHYHISTGQLGRLRRNENVSTYTLNQLCTILDCKLEDIAEYIKD